MVVAAAVVVAEGLGDTVVGNCFAAELSVHLAGAVEFVVGGAVAPPRWTEHHILADREPTEEANCL